MLLRSLWVFFATIIAISLHGVPQASAAEQNLATPAWLKRHVGNGNGQIAPVVLQRARALYQRKVREGVVSNACYMAMDATRPNSWNGAWPQILHHLRGSKVLSGDFFRPWKWPQAAPCQLQEWAAMRNSFQQYRRV